jgi:hypothetical protein
MNMTKDNDEVRGKFRTLNQTTKEEVFEYKKSINDLLASKKKLEEENDLLQQSVQASEVKMDELIEQNKVDIEQNNKEWRIKLDKQEAMNKEMRDKEDIANDYLKDKNKKDNEIIDLKQQLEDLGKKMNEEITVREREKIKATEGLRKEMLHKIKETKANLLALNDDQL